MGDRGQDGIVSGALSSGCISKEAAASPRVNPFALPLLGELPPPQPTVLHGGQAVTPGLTAAAELQRCRWQRPTRSRGQPRSKMWHVILCICKLAAVVDFGWKATLKTCL